MALLMTEGFDWLQPGWSGATVDEEMTKMGWTHEYGGRSFTYDGRYGGYAMSVWGSSQVSVRKSFSPTGGSQHIYMGFAGKAHYTIDGAGVRPMLINSAGGSGVDVHFTINGGVVVSDANWAEVGRSLGGYFTPETWFYGEVYVYASKTAGIITVRINGVEVINIVNVKTLPTNAVGYLDMLVFSGRVGGYYGTGVMDDIYVCDNTPGGPSGFLGPVRVQTLFPSGPGDTTQLSPSNMAYPNWQMASNPAIDDGSYVYGTSGTPGAYDLYAADDLLAVSTVYGVKPVVINRQSDAAPPQFVANTAMKTNGSVFLGAGKNSAASYLPSETVYGQNPATGAAWTTAQVNSIQFGPKQG